MTKQRGLFWSMMAVLIIVSMVILMNVLDFAKFLRLPGATPYTYPDTALRSTAESLVSNPMPLPSSPSFLSLPVPPGATVSQWQNTCLLIRQAAFWVLGSDSEEFNSHMISNTTVTVDKQIIDPSVTTFAILAKDDQGNYAPGPIEICFIINLSSGPHYFQIKVQPPLGDDIIYSWAWVIQ